MFGQGILGSTRMPLTGGNGAAHILHILPMSSYECPQLRGNRTLCLYYATAFYSFQFTVLPTKGFSSPAWGESLITWELGAVFCNFRNLYSASQLQVIDKDSWLTVHLMPFLNKLIHSWTDQKGRALLQDRPSTGRVLEHCLSCQIILPNGMFFSHFSQRK